LSNILKIRLIENHPGGFTILTVPSHMLPAGILASHQDTNTLPVTTYLLNCSIPYAYNQSIPNAK